MKLLYITTFNLKLYEQSGHDLIESFLKHITFGDMLVCYEDIQFINPNSDRIKSYDMTNDKYMCDWLTVNAERIPEFYGGLAGDDHPIVEQFNLKKGQYWANHRASRYFRKIVALNYALINYQNDYDAIFVIDCDCLFKQGISEYKITSELFKDKTSMIYFWSQHRRQIERGPETGFTGYWKINNGFEFAKKICECFKTQDFLRFTYWDDGYVIGRLIIEHEDDDNYVFYDLVGSSTNKTTRVMEIKNQPLFGFVHHFKNRHQTSL